MDAKTVLTHQLQGVMLHHDLMLAYAVLGKNHKCRMQRAQMYEEMRNHDKTNFAVIKEIGGIIDTGPVSRVKVPDVTASMPDEQKAAACKSLLDIWYKWEQATVQLYTQELSKDPQNKWLKCLKVGAEKELHYIEWHYAQM